MRLNKLIAQTTGIGRRPADAAIAAGRVRINGTVATVGQEVSDGDAVTLDDKPIGVSPVATTTIMLNKPAGYIVSRNGQGSKTIYDILPPEYQLLKPVGRLDKDTSGVLLLTNDGALANELTHPSRQKTKIYEVTLDKPLAPLHQQMVTDYGVLLDDGPSKFMLEHLSDDRKQWKISMHEGRNRQIRRTFKALGYGVVGLHRTQFGSYRLDNLAEGNISPA